MLSIGQLAPALSIETLSGKWSLGQSRMESGTIVLFLRDPADVLSIEYVSELEKKMSLFKNAGIDVIALSSQSKDRTAHAATAASLSQLALGFDGLVEQGLDWDVMVSELPYGSTPRHVFEPAMFLIGPDRTVIEAVVSSAALWRPDYDRIMVSLHSPAYCGGNIRRVWQASEERLAFPDGRGGRPVWSRHPTQGK